MTLDQFDEYPDYIPYEPVESDGQIGKLLRNIMKHEDPVKTRQIDLDGGEELYAWLRDTADEVLAADQEWRPWRYDLLACGEEINLYLLPAQALLFL